MILEVYQTFGLTATLKFATRPEQRIGDDAMWDRAEADLRAALDATGFPYELKAGDGAFYGPKIDFDVSDSIGRKWQLGTIQLDYAAAGRFDLTYVGEDNAEHRPVVIHRAMAGSFERFLAILIEHFAGAFPVWLAPEQVRVIPISDAQVTAARGVLDRLTAAGIRAHLDDRSETLNYRIREGEIWKVPYMAIVGQREAESDSLALRARGAGKKQEVMTVDAFVARVQEEVRTRATGLTDSKDPGLFAHGLYWTDLRDRLPNSRHSLRRPYADRTLSRRAFGVQRPAARRHGHPRCRRPRRKSIAAAVDEVIMGQVVQGGSGQAPARQALIHAGFPPAIPALTINKVCGSGLKAVMLASQAIKAGDAECVVAGGQEAMSSAPHYVYGMRAGIKAGNQTMVDGMIHDGLWDSFGCCHMGEYAEYTAEKAGVSREDQDAFAVDSHRKARGRHRGRAVQGRDPSGADPGQGRPDHRRDRRVLPEGHQRGDARQAQARVQEGRGTVTRGQRAGTKRRRQRAGGDVARLREGPRPGADGAGHRLRGRRR